MNKSYIFLLLLSPLCFPGGNLSTTNKSKESPEISREKKCLEEIHMLLKEKANLNNPLESSGQKKLTPLFYSIYKNDLSLMNKVLLHGASPNQYAIGQGKWHPLALCETDKEIELLMQNGADPSLPKSQNSDVTVFEEYLIDAQSSSYPLILQNRKRQYALLIEMRKKYLWKRESKFLYVGHKEKNCFFQNYHLRLSVISKKYLFF